MNRIRLHPEVVQRGGSQKQERPFGPQDNGARNASLQSLDLEITEPEETRLSSPVGQDEIARSRRLHGDAFQLLLGNEGIEGTGIHPEVLFKGQFTLQLHTAVPQIL
jgi:hypothetical protein